MFKLRYFVLCFPLYFAKKVKFFFDAEKKSAKMQGDGNFQLFWIQRHFKGEINFVGLTIGGSTMDGMEAFVIDSNDALKFRLLKNASDADIADPDDEFEPVMSHQIYGEK